MNPIRIRPRASRSSVLLAILVCIPWTAATSPGYAAQARSYRPIRPPALVEAEAVEEGAPTLPSAAECEAAARRIAAAYGPEGLRPWLHQEFPNREELLDSLARVDLGVTRLELLVESIESVAVLPWRPVERPALAGGDMVLASDCIVDLRTRLVFDDPDTGERVVRPPARAQWRLRLVVQTAAEGTP